MISWNLRRILHESMILCWGPAKGFDSRWKKCLRHCGDSPYQLLIPQILNPQKYSLKGSNQSNSFLAFEPSSWWHFGRTCPRGNPILKSLRHRHHVLWINPWHAYPPFNLIKIKWLLLTSPLQKILWSRRGSDNVIGIQWNLNNKPPTNLFYPENCFKNPLYYCTLQTQELFVVMSPGLVLGHDFGLLHGWVCLVRCWRGVQGELLNAPSRKVKQLCETAKVWILREKIVISVKTYRYKYCSWIRTKLAQLKQTIDHPFPGSQGLCLPSIPVWLLRPALICL